MSEIRCGMPASQDEILDQAIARNCAVVLSLLSEGTLQHHKSRFLSGDSQGVWLESVPSEHALIEQHIVSGQQCAISFKSSEKKVSFIARVLQLDAQFKVNEQTVLPALLVDRPSEVKAIQRRKNYRVRIPQDSGLRTRMWKIPEHWYLTDKPTSAAEMSVQLRDISTGGVGVTFLSRSEQSPRVLADERIRVAIKPEDQEEFVLEGRIRSPRPDPDGQSIRAGVQFTKLQDGVEGRQILSELTKIVGALQLDDVRHRRLGLS